MALITDIDQLSVAISHATAPAFMLGAVAGFLTILIARLERVADKSKALRLSDENYSIRPAPWRLLLCGEWSF